MMTPLVRNTSRLALVIFWVSLANCWGRNPWTDPGAGGERYQILFNLSSASAPEKIRGEAVSLVRSARQEIHFAMRQFDDPDFAEVLAEAHKSGIEVKVYWDEDQGLESTGAEQLLQAGIPEKAFVLGNKGSDNLMAHNIIFVDNRRVWISSGGLTTEALEIQANITLLFSGGELGLPREFQREFSLMRKGGFGSTKSKTDLTTKYIVFDKIVKMYFAPQENPMEVMAGEVREARQSIDFFSSGFETTSTKEREDLKEVMLEKIQEGVPVRGIFEETAAGGEAATYLNACLDPESGAECYSPDTANHTVFKKFYRLAKGLSANFMILDRGTIDERVIISTHPWTKKADSAHDGLLFILYGPEAVNIAQDFFDILNNHESTREFSPIPSEMEEGQIIISELLWMGSLTNDLEADSTDEFIEVYNNSSDYINLSKARILCFSGNDPADLEDPRLAGDEDATGDIIVEFPSGYEIPPGAYHTITRNPGGQVIQFPDYPEGLRTLSNGTTYCELRRYDTDSAVVIDKVGDASWSFDSNEVFLGSADTTYGMRSMERRKVQVANATSIDDWATNSLKAAENTWGVNDGFREKTFASPGQAPQIPEFTNGVPGNILVSELLWMGSRDNSGQTLSDDEFIEFYNATNETVHLTGYRLECGPDSANLDTEFTIPGGYPLEPGEFFVVAKQSGGVVHNPDLEANVSVSNSHTLCRVYSYDDVIVDEIGDGVTPWSGQPVHYGTKDEEPYRSMERRDLTDDDGTSIYKWSANVLEPGSNKLTVGTNYTQSVMATPGAAPQPAQFTEGTVQDLFITELLWMGSRANTGDGASTDEYIEVYNNSGVPLHLTAWSIHCGPDSSNLEEVLTFPGGYKISAGEYFVVSAESGGAVANPDLVRDFSGTGLVSTDTICRVYSYHDNSTAIDEIGDGATAWSTDTTHYGSNGDERRSMERQNLAVDGTNINNWRTNLMSVSQLAADGLISDGFDEATFGTPGGANFNFVGTSGNTRDVVINELHWAGSSTGGANDDWVELRNLTGSEIDLTLWTLDIRGDGSQVYTLPPGSVIAAGGYLVLGHEQATDTALDGLSGIQISTTIDLSTNSSQNDREMILFDFEGDEVDRTPTGDGAGGNGWPAGDATNDYSMERQDNLTGSGYADGSLASSWYTWNAADGTSSTDADSGTSGTPGQANSDPNADYPKQTGSLRDVVINEINWYGSSGGGSDDEWIELFNTTGSTINLYDWTLTFTKDEGDVVYTFPNGTTIGAGQYLVVGNEQDTNTSLEGVSNVILWDSSFSLINDPSASEHIELRDYADTLVDITPDGSGGNWVAGDNGTSYTMERKDAITGGGYADGSVDSNWYTWNLGDGTSTTGAGSGDNGTPGAANTDPNATLPAETLPYTNGFESSDDPWIVTTSGSFSNTPDASINPRNGSQVATFANITSTYTGREIQMQNCIQLNNDTDTVNMEAYGVNSINSGDNVRVRWVVYWYDDQCVTANSTTSDETGSGVILNQSTNNPALSGDYNTVTAAFTPPLGAAYIKIGLQMQEDSNVAADFALDDVTISQP